MPEKIVIAEVDINMEKALADSVELRKRIGLLKALMKEAKDTTGESSVEYIQYSASLKAATTQLRTHEAMLAKVIQTDNSATGSIEQMRTKLSVVSKQWAELSKEERLNTEAGQKLSAQKLALTNALKKEELATGDARRNVGNYAEALGQLPGRFGMAINSAKSFGKTLTALSAIPIILVITGIVAALTGLFKIFKSTAEGGGKLKDLFAALKGVMDVLRERAVSLINVFKDLFSGDFRKAGNDLKLTFQGLGEAIADIAREMIKLAQAQRELNKEMAFHISEEAEEINKIQEYLYLAKDKTKSDKERLNYLKEAIRLSREQANQEIGFAERQFDIDAGIAAHKAQIDKESLKKWIAMDSERQMLVLKSSEKLQKAYNLLGGPEGIKALEESFAKIINADTKFFEENKRAASQLSTLKNDLLKEAQEREIELKRIAAEKTVQLMRDEFAAFLKIAKQKEAIQTDLLQNKLPSLDDEYYKMRAEGLKVDAENQQAFLEQTLFGQLDAEKNALEKQKQVELDNAEKIGANKLLIERKYAKAEKAIEIAKRDAKLALAQGVAASLVELFGESTTAGKVAAVAMTTMETFRGAQAAFTGMIETFPGPWGIAAGVLAAAGAVAVGIANVKKILAVKTNGGGGGGGEIGASAPSSATAVAGTTSGMVQTQTSIGQGIVSRETMTPGAETPRIDTVLVVDAVTEKQMESTNKNKTSTL